MSKTPSGEASIAWNCRVHLIDDSTGQVDSAMAVCIAVAAITPGVTNAR